MASSWESLVPGPSATAPGPSTSAGPYPMSYVVSGLPPGTVAAPVSSSPPSHSLRHPSYIPANDLPSHHTTFTSQPPSPHHGHIPQMHHSPHPQYHSPQNLPEHSHQQPHPPPHHHQVSSHHVSIHGVHPQNHHVHPPQQHPANMIHFTSTTS